MTTPHETISSKGQVMYHKNYMGTSGSTNCPQCGKSGFVNVGGKRYCSACGAKLDGTSPTSLADIRPSGAPLDLRNTPAAQAAQKVAASAKPAAQLHGQQVGSGAVLDLRATTPTAAKTEPQPKVVMETKPEAAAQPAAIAAEATKPADTPAEKSPEKAEQPQEIPALAAQAETPAEPAPTLAPDKPKFRLLPNRKAQTAEAVAAPVTAAMAAAAPATETTAPAEIQPKVVPAPAPVKPSLDIAKPQPAASATPEPTPAVVATPAPARSPLFGRFDATPAELPNAAAGQIDAMSTQAATAPPPPATPQSPALQQALTAAKQSMNTPSVVKIGAAVAAVALMAGVTWVQNSPKLAFHNAAVQAGINATLPTYLPSSYRQVGPASVSPGQLTLNFRSPSSSNQLQIAQSQSNWDANSLRDNYVTRQTDNYLAVQGQGLTIYLYGNEADWVNHGVWYKVSGINGLSQEQVLKIIYGL